jgi:hypothetical protein
VQKFNSVWYWVAIWDPEQDWHWSNMLDPDPVRKNAGNQCYGSGSSILSVSGSRVLMTKNLTKYSWTKIYLSFVIKIAINLSLGLLKRRRSYRRSLRPSKKNTQHSKKWNLLSFLSIFKGNFCPSGSRSGSRDPTEPGSNPDPDPQDCWKLWTRDKPGLHEPLSHKEGDKVPCRVALRILLDGGVAGGHVVEPGHAQLAQEPLPVLRTRRPHIVHGHHLPIAPWNLWISIADPRYLSRIPDPNLSNPDFHPKNGY